jgi:hypothetical protein
VTLEQATPFQNRDFPMPTDYRALFGGVFAKGYGLDQRRVHVFPGIAGRELGMA